MTGKSLHEHHSLCVRCPRCQGDGYELRSWTEYKGPTCQTLRVHHSTRVECEDCQGEAWVLKSEPGARCHHADVRRKVDGLIALATGLLLTVAVTYLAWAYRWEITNWVRGLSSDLDSWFSGYVRRRNEEDMAAGDFFSFLFGGFVTMLIQIIGGVTVFIVRLVASATAWLTASGAHVVPILALGASLSRSAKQWASTRR